MPLARRSFFLVGVYDPLIYDSWPYFHGFDDGIFLSKNKRFCKFNSAIKFDSPLAARQFYSEWKHADRYRLYPFEYKTYVEVPAHVFPDDHPNSIFKRICQNESSYVQSTAITWLRGRSDYLWSKSTVAKHRKILLLYGIDIYTTPERLWELPPSLDDDTWYLSKPGLTIA